MRAFVTGRWADKSLCEKAADDFEVYDWTSNQHNCMSYDDQAHAIWNYIDNCDVFILSITDSDYGYGASRLQMGYALGRGKLCIIVDPNMPYETPHDEKTHDMIQNMFYYVDNIRIVPCWEAAVKMAKGRMSEHKAPEYN